jgi:hypothetical protein
MVFGKWPVWGIVIYVSLFGTACTAAQIDISGPPGSLSFGETVRVLPNGNLVVTDPIAKHPVTGEEAGAVYLFDTAGNLISALRGTTFGDLGGARIVVLPTGNFVVISDTWDNGAASGAGAVTLVNGTTGLSGEVSAANSLVGNHTNDFVGVGGVLALANGNFLVLSENWNSSRGAVTWVHGEMGFVGEVSPANSLVGSAPYDYVGIGYVGNVVALSNGNYVVGSPQWSGSAKYAGAATWGDGSRGVLGEISSENSLIGTSDLDGVGFTIAALANGNYVVASPGWSNAGAAHVGAATWANGASGITGTISETNSLVGSSANDTVASGVNGLANQSIVPLTNGNYVVSSPSWSNGDLEQVGAATWCDGARGRTGYISGANSLIGSSTRDRVSYDGVVALSNGNYVVQSPLWSVPGSWQGAVTWANGSSGQFGEVTSANSLVGDAAHPGVGSSVIPLTNGNYVNGRSFNAYRLAPAPGWAMWGSGDNGVTGTINAGNALLGTDSTGAIGYLQALANGNFLVLSPDWGDQRGAVTWFTGSAKATGAIDATNSFTSSAGDRIGHAGIHTFPDGTFAIISMLTNRTWAVSYSRGTRRFTGSPNDTNTLFAAGPCADVDYDPVRERLVVGRPVENLVSLRGMNLFADGFEQE